MKHKWLSYDHPNTSTLSHSTWVNSKCRVFVVPLWLQLLVLHSFVTEHGGGKACTENVSSGCISKYTFLQLLKRLMFTDFHNHYATTVVLYWLIHFMTESNWTANDFARSHNINLPSVIGQEITLLNLLCVHCQQSVLASETCRGKHGGTLYYGWHIHHQQLVSFKLYW